eukprot:g7165.t1
MSPQQVVAQATCLQHWAAHYSASMEEMRTAGLLEPQKGDSLAFACTSGLMPQTAPRAPPSRGTLRATSGGRKVLTACPFLFFQLIKPKTADSSPSASSEPSQDAKPRPRLDAQLLEDLDLKELPGDVLAPTLACNVTLLGEGALLAWN